jgi:photosystem II stability/assembly factor-like uncharacterized protein
MKKHFILAALFFLSCAKSNQAQEPRWELLARGLYGVIAVDPTNSNVIYVASRNSGQTGMWKSTDGGRSWTLYKNGWGIGSPTDILIDPNNPQVILACGGPFVGVQKSVDGGQNWFRADSGLVPDHHGYDVWSLALDNQRRIFYLGDQGIFTGVARSMNGTRWQLADANYPFPALDLAVDERTGVLYAGSGNGVWKSLNLGSSWIQISNGLNVSTILHVIKLKQSNTLYAATFRGIYKSTNGGENWFSVNDAITSKLNFRHGLVVSDVDTNTIYAAAEVTLDPALPGGIYRSQTGGKSWVLYKLGLSDSITNFYVTNIFLDNKANALYASMTVVLGGNRSEINIYRLRNAATTSIADRRYSTYPTSIALYSYPNPSNTPMRLIYSIHQRGRVQLRIFDILGKEVITLLDEARDLGEYRILWGGVNAEGKRLPSGIYLARLQLGKEFKTIKLLLTQ